jgi:capsular polysaccharide export protein
MERKMKALFITESMADLRCHMKLAQRLRNDLGIIFLVKAKSLRTELWKHGFPSFSYNELLTPEIERLMKQWWEENCSNPIEALSFQGIPLMTLMEYERGLADRNAFGDELRSAVRQWALPLPSRLREGGDLDPAQDHRTLVAALLCRTVGLIESFSRLLRFIQPHMILVWNGLSLPTTACAEVAARHGIPLVFSDEGYLPNTMVIDPAGVHARSSLCDGRWERLAAEPLADHVVQELRACIESYRTAGETRASQTGAALSPGEVCTRLRLADGERVVLYAAQMDTDASTVLSSPTYPTNDLVLEDLAKAAAGIPGARIVVKPHPRERDHGEALAGALGDRGCVVDGIQLSSLLATASAVVVRSGPAGLEALTWGRPVLALGRAIYSDKGFTYDVRRREDLAPTLRHALETGGLPTGSGPSFDRFMVYLTQHYLYRLDDGEESRRVNEAIERGLLSTIHAAVPPKRDETVPQDRSQLSRLLKEQGPQLRRAEPLRGERGRTVTKTNTWGPLKLAPDEIRDLIRTPQGAPPYEGR